MNEILILFILKINSANIYEIRKQINMLFAPVVQLSTGAIIPALNRLEAKGLVEKDKTISDGGLKKTNYVATQDADKYFFDNLNGIRNAAPQILRRDIDVLFMMLNHSALSDDENNQIIETLIELLNANIKSLEVSLKDNKMNADFIKIELDNSLLKLNLLKEISKTKTN